MRYNPPPNWPSPPPNWTPPPGWQPDPAWGPPPPGWEVWQKDEPQGNWFSRHKVLTGIGAFLLLGIIGSAFSGDPDQSDAQPSAQQTSEPSPEAPASAPPSVAAPAPAAACAAAAPAMAQSVSQGRTSQSQRIAGGQVVPLTGNDFGQFTVVYAARIEPLGQVATWALGSAQGAGPIYALNDAAREVTDWGAAAQPGSRADDLREAMENSDAASAAEGCVG